MHGLASVVMPAFNRGFIIREALESIQEQGLTYTLDTLAWHYQTAAGLYFKAGDENNAHRCLRRAFLFSPFRPKTILSRVQRLIRSNI